MAFSGVVDSGILQYFIYDVAGNSMAAPKTVGIVTGGNTNSGGYKSERNEGINQKETFYAGLNKYAPTVNGRYGPDTKAFLAKALRAGGALPSIDVDCGSTQQGWNLATGAIDKFEISIGEDQNPITFSASLMMLKGVHATGAVVEPALTGSPYASFNSVVTVGATDFGVKTCKISIMNNLEVGSTSSAKASGTLRDPTYLLVNKEQFTVEIESLNPLSVGGGGVDSPAENIGVVVVLGGATTLTFANLAFDEGSFNQEFKVKGAVRFKNKLIGAYGACVLT